MKIIIWLLIWKPALAGLPAIAYKTGGSPESAGVDAVIIEPGGIQRLQYAIEQMIGKKNKNISKEALSSKEKFVEYTELYRGIHS